MAMVGPLKAEVRLRKRWWYPVVYWTGIALSVCRLLSERNAERWIDVLVDRGTVIEVDLVPAD